MVCWDGLQVVIDVCWDGLQVVIDGLLEKDDV